MEGDVSQPDLGLSPEDCQTLIANVNVVIHSAATLDFADGLKMTVDINLLGTRRMLELASQCQNLAVFVHVSSAYVNSWRLDCEEVRIKKKRSCTPGSTSASSLPLFPHRLFTR